MSQAHLMTSSLKVSSAEDETTLFRFSEGAVVTAFDPGRGSGAALLVQAPADAPASVDAALAELGKSVAFGAPGLLVKVVGTPSSLARAEQALSKRGVAPAVRHEIGNSGEHEVYFYPRSGRLRASRGPAEAQAPAPKRARVLIVDDARTIRGLMRRILESDPGIEVLGAAPGPEEAEEMIARLKPDVVTLDIHMPGMDGVTLLKRYLPRHPVPTVVISSISMEEGPFVLSALEAGAVEYIQKPSFNELKAMAPLIVDKIKAAASAKVRIARSAPVRQRRASRESAQSDASRLIAIGSSTGGTEAVRRLLAGLPESIPPIAIVQHIPPVFSKAFAMRLNDLMPFEVKEAEDGDLLVPNRVLIAPGGKQMSVRRVPGSSTYKTMIDDSPPVNRHKPSVDVLFHSVAKEAGPAAIGVILTGMGADGAKGLLEMRRAGSPTLAQDEASCVVFGMPREAIRQGAAERVLSLDDIASELVSLLSLPPKALGRAG